MRAKVSAPQRRCAVSGQRQDRQELVRFALDCVKEVTPDIAEKLPGRGVWISTQRAILQQAIRRNSFARAFKSAVSVPPNLLDTVEHLLARRLIEAIGVLRKAGHAVAGFDKTRQALKAGKVYALFEAGDAAEGGREKLRRIAIRQDIPVISCLRGDELGVVFAREGVVHVAARIGELERAAPAKTGIDGLRARLLRDSNRLKGVRCVQDPSQNIQW